MVEMKWIYFFERLICLFADCTLRKAFYLNTSFLPAVNTESLLMLIQTDAAHHLLTTLTTRFDEGS